MFEVLTILFVLLGIVGSILQATRKGKHADTGFPPPIKAETRKIDMDEDKNLSSSQKPIRKGTYKSVPKQTEQVALTGAEVNPVAMKNSPKTKLDSEKQLDEISLDHKSVLNGIIFSVILSPPKSKRMDSIL